MNRALSSGMKSMATQISYGDIDLKRMVIVIVCVRLFLAFGNAENLSGEEYLKLKRHLKLVNKPAVKSIKTNDGDIFDCVDMYKQRAFDHPLLKNHTLQMRPSSLPIGMEKEEASDNGRRHAEMKLGDGGCPEGTVAVRRIRMRDLLRAPHIYLHGKKYNTNESTHATNDKVSAAGHHWANVQVKGGKFFGTSVYMNIWQPQVADSKMFSLAQLWVTGGPNDAKNTIEAGWTVSPDLYHDQRSRFFVYWTGDGYRSTGCYNDLCPGYVQVSHEIPLGLAIEPISTYGGHQTEIKLLVYKDPKNLDWWLIGRQDNHAIGYFPKSLFPYLGNNPASRIDWGGEIYNPTTLPHPPMGSGHFSGEGLGKASFMRKLKIIDGNNAEKDAPNGNKYSDLPKCYDVDSGKKFDPTGDQRHFFFGGPGGVC